MENSRFQTAGARYSEGKLASAGPKELVLLMYEKVLEEIATARQCLANGDAMRRSRAVTRALQGLTELILSLDLEKGGEHSKGLQEVYGYLQNGLIKAHAEQSAERFASISTVLGVMCRNWRETCSLLNGQEPLPIEDVAPVDLPEPVARWQPPVAAEASAQGWEA